MTNVTKIRYIMQKSPNYDSVNNVSHPVICEGWQLTDMWKTLAWPHHFTKGPYN